MNKEIKDIFGKHKVVIVNSENTFKQALIEICELQKQLCAYEIKDINYEAWVNCINTKNIAKNE